MVVDNYKYINNTLFDYFKWLRKSFRRMILLLEWYSIYNFVKFIYDYCSWLSVDIILISRLDSSCSFSFHLMNHVMSLRNYLLAFISGNKLDTSKQQWVYQCSFFSVSIFAFIQLRLLFYHMEYFVFDSTCKNNGYACYKIIYFLRVTIISIIDIMSISD